MPRLVPALILSAALLLSGCNAATTKPANSTPEADPIEQQLAIVQKNVKEWQTLSDAKIEPLRESAGTFSAEQIEQISEDVLKIAEAQLDANQATSKEEVEQHAYKVTNAAPGMLADFMEKQAKQDEKDKRNEIFSWAMIYAQPISESFEIEDSSRLTYAWSAVPELVGEQNGVTVTLFIRTAYWLADGDGGNNVLGVGRWISLSTADPSYTASTGDYGWRLDTQIYNADICSAADHEPLRTDDSLNVDSLREFVSLDPSKFASTEELDIDEKKAESAVAKCASQPST